MSVKADVHVPRSTVAVTRGGELSGRVVAREFLLEDGELLPQGGLVPHQTAAAVIVQLPSIAGNSESMS